MFGADTELSPSWSIKNFPKVDTLAKVHFLLLERTDNDGLPTEDSENGILVSTVEKTYNGGYNTDDPVLIRKRN